MAELCYRIRLCRSSGQEGAQPSLGKTLAAPLGAEALVDAPSSPEQTSRFQVDSALTGRILSNETATRSDKEPISVAALSVNTKSCEETTPQQAQRINCGAVQAACFRTPKIAAAKSSTTK